MILSYRFSAPWWAWLLTAALTALFLRLGFWQMSRAEEKKSIISAYQQAAKSQPADAISLLKSGSRPPYARALQLRGRFEPERSLLLDNQVLRGGVGYHVWTPLRLADGELLLVDRGWVATGPDRRVLPRFESPSDEVSLRGVWQPLPRPGLRIGVNSCAPGPWPRVVQYPLFEELRCILGPTLQDGVLWLDPAEPQGFERAWTVSGFPPERHYGYALQWFALAATLLLLFIVVNFRRIPAS